MLSSLSVGIPRPSSITLSCRSAVHRRDFDGYGRVRLGELDGVAEQIGDDLHKPVRVGLHRREFRLHHQADACRVGHRLHGVDNLLGEFIQERGAEVERGAARLHALEVEDVVDQTHQPVGVGDGNTQQVGSLVRDLPEQS